MKAPTAKALNTKAGSLRRHPVRIARALRYPTYRRLAMQRVLARALGSIMMSAGNLHALGFDGLHGSGSIGVMTAHIVAHVVMVVP